MEELFTIQQQHYAAQQIQHQMISFTTAYFMTAVSSMALGQMKTKQANVR